MQKVVRYERSREWDDVYTRYHVKARTMSLSVYPCCDMPFPSHALHYPPERLHNASKLDCSVQLIIPTTRLSLFPTMHHLELRLWALRPLFLGLLGRYELEVEYEELSIRFAVLQDVSKRVCTLLVRPRSSLEVFTA